MSRTKRSGRDHEIDLVIQDCSDREGNRRTGKIGIYLTLVCTRFESASCDFRTQQRVKIIYKLYNI
jgi:hypothetical protein